jgi:hypothetical protein
MNNTGNVSSISLEQICKMKINISRVLTKLNLDQPGHPHSLIRIHAVCLQNLFCIEKLIGKGMDKTGQMRMLVWIHAAPKLIMLVMS